LGTDVTAALARLQTLDGLDTADHVAVFELVQAELAAALADIDMPSGSGGSRGPQPGPGAAAAAATGFDRRPVPGRPPR
nr:hypothetical protein [Micromonospora sp. DSM 115978]